MATGVQLDAMLTSSPDVCGGRLRIAGTRVTVLQIVTLYKRGETAEEIAESYPHVTLAQVYAALAYYHANQAAIEQELADEVVEYDRLKQQYAPRSGRPEPGSPARGRGRHASQPGPGTAGQGC
jgi:uncharacterized protein (DUF433 family)